MKLIIIFFIIKNTAGNIFIAIVVYILDVFLKMGSQRKFLVQRARIFLSLLVARDKVLIILFLID